MKKQYLFLFLLSMILVASTISLAQDKGFGLGVILGEPTGLSGKYWLNEKTAIDGAVAWSFYHEASFHLHGDYLFHNKEAFETEEPFALYYGVGGRIKATENSDTQVGIRGVVGIDYLARSVPFDIFLEIAPILDLTPTSDLVFNAGLGARFFFE